MAAEVGNTEAKAYVICAMILFVKFVMVTAIQAKKSFHAGGRPPEDRDLALAHGRREQTYGLAVDENDVEHRKAREVERRWRRIVGNDLESIPIALLIFAGGVIARGDRILFTILIALYTFFRCLHTFAYAKELQPLRSWCWRLGVLMVFIESVNAIVGAFS